MATVCKIALDAEEYRRTLAAVLAETKTALAALPEKQLPVTADTVPAQQALSDLSDKSALSEKQLPVTADTKPAETELKKVANRLDDLPNKEIEVTADTVAATVRIVELKAQIADLESKEIKAQVKVVDDQIKLLRQELDTLQDKDISVRTEADIQEAGKLRAVIAALEDKKVLIKTEVHSEKLDQLRQELKNIEAGAQAAEKALENLGDKTGKSGKDAQQAKGFFAQLRGELNNTQGGVKKLVSTFLAGGGAFGIIAAGAASVVKIVQTLYDNWRSRLKENAELHQRNSESIREAAEANEAVRQKSDGYLNSLAALAKQEKLSNADKIEARKLIDELARSYGELGIRIDEASGHLVGFDAAMAKKGERDKAARLAELQTELRQNEAEAKKQREIRDTAGIPVWFGGNTRLGGEAETKEAGKALDELGKRAAEIRRKMAELRRTDPTADVRRKQQAEIAALKKQLSDLSDKSDLSDASDIAGLKPDEAAAKLRKLVAGHREKKIAPLVQQESAGKTAVTTAKTDVDRAEAQKNLLKTQIELKRELEQVHAWEKQIAQIKLQQSRAAEKMAEAAKFEAEYNELLLKGELDKAAALKLEKELKEQNLKLTEKEKQALLEQRRAAGAVNLRQGLRDQAKTLLGEAMTQAGRGREWTERKALDDATARKGSALTDAESAMVRRLSRLSASLSDAKDLAAAGRGDLEIKTNSLTARGGFASGGRAADPDRYNRQIVELSRTSGDLVRRINDLLQEVLKT